MRKLRPRNDLIRMNILEDVGRGEVMESRTVAPLSYRARRELLAQVIPRYQQASSAHKSRLLDRFVEWTGYDRKYAIRLLNRPREEKGAILRPRLPHYSPEVQQALFLAWRAVLYICPKRLMPFLPFLVPSLEQCGHLQLNEEQRRQLLSMSSATAERFLRTRHKPTPRGLSTTKAGTLLKHQIPIRTFAGWDNTRPGFLEADLVAHCGGNSEWERILTWICAHPERSTRDLFEELQRLFPGRYTLSHYPALQRGVRKIRAHLRKQAEEPWPIEIIHGLESFPAPGQGKHEAFPQGDAAPS